MPQTKAFFVQMDGATLEVPKAHGAGLEGWGLAVFSLQGANPSREEAHQHRLLHATECPWSGFSQGQVMLWSTGAPLWEKESHGEQNWKEWQVWDRWALEGNWGW